MISIPSCMPPRLWKRGIGAEADAVAGIFAGSADKIRPAVVGSMHFIDFFEGLSFIFCADVALMRDSFAAIFFVFNA